MATKKKNNTALILGVLAALATGAGIYFYTKKKDTTATNAYADEPWLGNLNK